MRLVLGACSTKDHQQADFAGIHDKICPLVGPLRNPPPVIGRCPGSVRRARMSTARSEEERATRNATLRSSMRALIDLTRSEAAAFLAAGDVSCVALRIVVLCSAVGMNSTSWLFLAGCSACGSR